MTPKLRALVVLVLLLTLPLPAYAYLDPQTGSMIVSGLVAFVAAVGMGVQAYWHKLISLVRRPRGRGEPPGLGKDESIKG
jgi:uncharacterized membrane protein